jgi:putative ABC transport system permease protein
MTMVVRPTSRAQQRPLTTAVREAVREFDADVPVELSTLDTFVTSSVADRRFLLMVLGTFAAIALLLAATGIYSVLSQSVAQRTQEIGIRMALGADAGSVVNLMLRTAMSSVGVGVGIGALGSVLAVRLLKTFLFNVKPLDPGAFAAAGAMLVCVAAVAAYVPARRATRVDPLSALRAR